MTLSADSDLLIVLPVHDLNPNPLSFNSYSNNYAAYWFPPTAPRGLSVFYVLPSHKPAPRVLDCCYCKTCVLGSNFYVSYMLLYNLLFSKHADLVLFTHDVVGQKSDRAQWAQLVSDLYDVDIWEKQFHEYHATD